MDNISWVCQDCGKAFIDSSFSYELKVSDMEACNRCGWKRKPKTPELIQIEKDREDGIIRGKDGTQWFVGKWRFHGAVINAPASRSNDRSNCCPRIC